jgi:uroporphyrinogen III methyltransferase/synthase
MEQKPEAPGAIKDVLLHKTILVTRQREQSVEFTRILESAGASVVLFPTIRIVEPENWEACDAIIRNIGEYDVIVFTSSNAVDRFMKRYSATGTEDLSSKRIFSVGPKTGEALSRFNLKAEAVPFQDDARQLAMNMIPVIDRKSKILFPHGNPGKYELADLLRESGLSVSEIVVYENIMPGKEELEKMKMFLENNKVDVITFFSPSSVENILKVISPQHISSMVIAVIGTTTSAAVMKLGLPVHIIAHHPTSKELADAITEYYIN